MTFSYIMTMTQNYISNGLSEVTHLKRLFSRLKIIKTHLLKGTQHLTVIAPSGPNFIAFVQRHSREEWEDTDPISELNS